MADPNYAQRVLLGLLHEAHPRMLDYADVRRQLHDVPRLDAAAEVLITDGLARRWGDLIGLTRAAVRADQLSL